MPKKNITTAPSPDRERLIVPEEIFAPEVSDREQDALNEENADTSADAVNADESSKEDVAKEDTSDEYTQMAFFEEDDEEIPPRDESDSSDWESIDEDGYNPEKPRIVDRVFDFVELIALTAITVLICTAFLFRHAVVDGSSMLGTLEHGEHLIISGLFYTPERGDIIVFEDHTLPENLRDPIVKRVIGIEGDVVKIENDGTVYVNGKEYKSGHEYYLEGYYITDNKPYYYAQGYEYTVPKGNVFVLGDNRNHSTDSRVLGPIDVDTILGKALIRVYPFDSFGKINKKDN